MSYFRSETPEEDAGVGAFFSDVLGIDLNIGQFIADYPWVLLIPLLAVWIGIHFGWKKLQMNFRMQGKPLRSLGTILKESFSLMYKEDIYPVIQSNQKLMEKTAWLNWLFYWKWISLFTIVILGISVLGLLTWTVALGTWIVIIILWLAGISHLRKVFAIRMHRLMQMFNVAAAEARYESGSVVDLYSYIQVQGWTDVYHPQTTVIMFPTKYKSEDDRNRTSFETNFSGSVTDQNSWTYKWESTQNRVICEPVPFIPANVPYPFPDNNTWDNFPLGITANGEEAIWDVSTYPHMLIAGTTGSGKSVTQRTILLHALQNPKWKVVLIDPKRVELAVYKRHPNVLKSVTSIEDSVALLEQLEAEMYSRYDQMEEEGGAEMLNNFEMLESPPPAILLMVDETFQLLSPTGIKNEEGKATDEMKARCGIILGNIARFGRAAGIHMVLATQRPDAKVLPGELKLNLDARIAQGRMDKTPSFMTLDSDAATHIPAIKGRAVYRAGGDGAVEFQAYFLAPEYLPEVLEMSEALAQGNNGFLNGGTADEAPAQIEFVEEEAPKDSIISKIKEWVERRQAKIAESEMRAGRTEEDRETLRERRKKKKHSDTDDSDSPASGISEARKAPDLAKIFAAARESKPRNSIPPLFEPAPPIDPAKLREPVRDPSDDWFTGDPSLMGEDWDDDLIIADEETDSEEENWDTAPPAFSYVDEIMDDLDDDYSIGLENELRESSEEPEERSQYEDNNDFIDYSSVADKEETYLSTPQTPEYPQFTVQDVIARAAERGAPIPASELMAALQAEATYASQIKQSVAPAQKADEVLTQQKMENSSSNRETSEDIFDEVIASPPGLEIPAPPPHAVRDKVREDSDSNRVKNDKKPDIEEPVRLNPLSAPWIPDKPVDIDPGKSPFGSGGLVPKKTDDETTVPKKSNGPQRPRF